MSRAQVRARNMSQLLDNLGKHGALSLHTMQLQLPGPVGVRYRATGSLRIGDVTLPGISGVVYHEWDACDRVRIEGVGPVACDITFFFRGYSEVRIRATGNRLIAFPVPLPDGWKYPDKASELTNMSRVGYFGDEKAPPGEG